MLNQRKQWNQLNSGLRLSSHKHHTRGLDYKACWPREHKGCLSGTELIPALFPVKGAGGLRPHGSDPVVVWIGLNSLLRPGWTILPTERLN